MPVVERFTCLTGPVVRHRRRFALQLVLVVLVFASRAYAQSEAPCRKQCLDFITVGGLLGYVDGLPVASTHSVDQAQTDTQAAVRPYGGLLGVAAWWRAHRS